METSRDKRTETEGTASMRLHYSRQFQNGGHAHTIDAEATLAIGASPEKREQVIRELESGVELLARQITQRGSRPTSEAHTQTSAPARSGATPARVTEPPTPPAAPARPASQAAQPAAPMPISESMPATPSASGERRITLPDFLNAIKKRWEMSPDEARELLDVNELTGLNYREAFATLRSIKEAHNPQNISSAQTRARTTQQQPVVEAPHQSNRGPAGASNPPPPASTPAPNTAPVSRAQATTALKHEAQPTPRAAQAAPTAPHTFAIVPEPELTPPVQERDSRPEFAGSSKAPLPIQFGVVRDMAPRYGFEEEDEEEYPLPENNQGNEYLRAAESKMEELRNIRPGNAASPERLNVLNNVLDGQLSDGQLEQLIKFIWNLSSKKKLRGQQVEALISWAKEDDYFVDEVAALLALVDKEND